MERRIERLPIYAGGFFFDPASQSVLLHKRDDKAPINPNKWGFFGGLAEGDETPEQCFIREMQEELNVALTSEEIIPLFNYLNEEMRTQRYIFYIHRYVDKKSLILGEGADFDWVALASLDALDLTDRTRDDLRRFFSDYLKN